MIVTMRYVVVVHFKLLSVAWNYALDIKDGCFEDGYSVATYKNDSL